MPLTPPVPTTLPSETASKATANAAVTANQALWLGSIADQIIAASKGGMFYTFVEDYKVTSTNSTALTTAGYTVATAANGQVKISWSA